MGLGRKPVEETQDPGYPSSNEYVTGRRAFIGLLGLTALGVGGAYLLKSRPASLPEGVAPVALPGKTAPVAPQPSAFLGTPPQPVGPSIPQAALGGEAVAPQTAVDGGLRPVRPQAKLKGAVRAVIAPEPAQPQAALLGRVQVVQPPARPKAALEGDVAVPQLPRIEVPADDAPKPLSVPQVEPGGAKIRVTQPQAATGGKPVAPVQPRP